jgi:Na+-translocating ferredoxin:NAD+ oxidoreductase RNF subunit RnfB
VGILGNSKFNQVRAILPNVNCGACGYPDCNSFAKAVIENNAQPNGCIPGGSKVAHGIADIMGVVTTIADPVMAVVHCKGGKKESFERAIYDGISDCNAATITGYGSKTCQYGCLGLGTCVKACYFDAISINENGVAFVDEDKCTGCGKCVKSCPRAVISLIPKVHKIFLGCSNHDEGPGINNYCKVGCTSCGTCVSATLSGAVSMQNNLPVLDYTQNENFIPAAYKCPSRCFFDLVQRRPKANIDTKCDGCGECVKVCPVDMAITGEKGIRHVVDKNICIGCGICLGICHTHAISLWGAGASLKTKSYKLKKK